MRSFWEVCVIFVGFLNVVAGARVLAVLGVNMRSHLNAFGAIVEHLAPYHDVTFIVDPEFGYSYPNVTNIHIPGQTISHVISKNKILENPCNIDYYDIYYYHVLHDDEIYYNEVYSNENFQRLFQSDQKFDVMIISSYGSDFLTILAHKFNLPIIQVSPSMLLPWTNRAVGNPNYLDNDYSFLIDDYTDTFAGRFVKYIKGYSMFRRYYKATVSKINKVWKKYFPDAPPVQDLLSKTELVFVNIHNSLGFPRSVATTVVEVGGMHVKAPKALPKDMEKFVSGPDGFIFFSLGTFITDSKFHPNMIKAMLNVFGKLKQKVLWKWNGEMEGVPKNVMVSKWFPQQDLLAHKDIKLFISQGGMMSLLEACTYGVPVMLMPAVFDQKTNAYLIKKLGYGLELDFCEFTEQLFYEMITDLISNATYKQQALQISSVMQYDRATVRDKINFWVNFVIENKRKSILRKTTPHIPWSQTTPVDIFLLLSTLAALVLIITVWGAKRIKSWAIFVKKEEKVKSY